MYMYFVALYFYILINIIKLINEKIYEIFCQIYTCVVYTYTHA